MDGAKISVRVGGTRFTWQENGAALAFASQGVALWLSGGVSLNIKSLARLRALLFEMEKTLGLVDLSANERDVLYAINEVSSGSPRSARSEAIRNHPLAAAIPQATYHRALKSLVQRGLVAHAPDTRAGHYVVKDSAD